MSRDAGDVRGVVLSGGNLGHVLAHERRLDEALGLQREALLLEREHSDVPYVSNTLVEIAAIAIARSDFEAAAILVGGAAALLEATGFELDPVLRTSYEEICAVLEAEVETETLALATTRGYQMPLDELVSYAIEFTDSAVGADPRSATDSGSSSAEVTDSRVW